MKQKAGEAAVTDRLTELEGAILSEIEHRGHQTAYQVRTAFADSFSLEWKGSAGSVYPAVKRLEQAGLLQASKAQGGRSTRRLELTEAGRNALEMWACDPALASSVGIDPFRLRAGIWASLPREKQALVLAGITQAIEASAGALAAYVDQADPVERVRIALALDVQISRLNRLKLGFRRS